MAGDLVPVAYGGRPPADGARLAPLMSQGGEVGGDDADMCRQGCGAPGGTPAGEVPPVRGVGRPGRHRLLRLRIGHGRVDLGRGQRAGQRRTKGDQVMQVRGLREAGVGGLPADNSGMINV